MSAVSDVWEREVLSRVLEYGMRGVDPVRHEVLAPVQVPQAAGQKHVQHMADDEAADRDQQQLRPQGGRRQGQPHVRMTFASSI